MEIVQLDLVGAVTEAKRALLKDGVVVKRHVGEWCLQPEGILGMKELHNVLIKVENPIQMWHNKVNSGLLVDTLDILLGLNPGYVQKVWKFYNRWLTRSGKYPYTYGERIFGGSVNQWAECVHKLRHEPSTRQAYFVIVRPDDLRIEYTPCSIGMQFYVDDAQRLCGTYEMRSNDIAIGGLPRNLFIGCSLLVQMSLETGIRLGTYSHFDVNLHHYPNKPEDLETLEGLKAVPNPMGNPTLLDEAQKRTIHLVLGEFFEKHSRTNNPDYGGVDPYWNHWIDIIEGVHPS